MPVAATASHFLGQLRGALASTMLPEMNLTLEIGVMSAAGLTRSELLAQVRTRHPDVDELDIKMAHLRLKRVVGGWAL